MSKINKSRNLFLEKEELVRWDRFYQDDGLKDFIKRTVKFGGIVPGLDGNIGANFQFELGSAYNKIKLTEDSVAYNTLGERIFYKHQTGYEWEAPGDGVTPKDSWVYIEYTTTPIEEGTLTLAVNGAVTGTSTKFTEVFRGESTLVPNKIRIYQRTQAIGTGSGYDLTLKGTYEVSEVVSNTSMFINTAAALAAGTYVYSVVGAFSPGTFDDTRQNEIYSYDSVNVVFSDTDPLGTLTADQYLLCKVTIIDTLTSQTLVDLRYRNGDFSSIDSSTWKLKVDNGWVDVTDSLTIAGILNPSVEDPLFLYKINHDGTISIRGTFGISYNDTGTVETISGTIIPKVDGSFPKIDGAVVPQLFVTGNTASLDTNNMTFQSLNGEDFTFKVKLETGTYDKTISFFAILNLSQY